LHKIDEIRTVVVLDVKREAVDITTIYFKDKIVCSSKPGQYLMVWVPGEDEVPMSISTIEEKGLSSITVRKVGNTTEILSTLKIGAKIGIRGPFGNNYEIKGEKPLIVAGGSGAANLLPLVKEFLSQGVKPTFVLGGRSSDQLLFEDVLVDLLRENLVITTDDGSMGYSGYASGYAAILMAENKYDQVYTCGPELMMTKIFYEAEKQEIQVQASLERYIKCAVGLCGNCAIGTYRVCTDGPIFTSKMLNNVRDEFGISLMDASGIKTRVNH
jgi:dihydroorotate dehydrogenase electron transfer subunit